MMGVSWVGRVVCVPCRHVSVTSRVDSEGLSHCLQCDGPVLHVGSRWRAPRKSQDGAWKRIAAGDVLWDHRAVERPLRRRIDSEQWLQNRRWRRWLNGHSYEDKEKRHGTSDGR